MICNKKYRYGSNIFSGRRGTRGPWWTLRRCSTTSSPPLGSPPAISPPTGSPPYRYDLLLFLLFMCCTICSYWCLDLISSRVSKGKTVTVLSKAQSKSISNLEHIKWNTNNWNVLGSWILGFVAFYSICQRYLVFVEPMFGYNFLKHISDTENICLFFLHSHAFCISN